MPEKFYCGTIMPLSSLGLGHEDDCLCHPATNAYNALMDPPVDGDSGPSQAKSTHMMDLDHDSGSDVDDTAALMGLHGSFCVSDCGCLLCFMLGASFSRRMGIIKASCFGFAVLELDESAVFGHHSMGSSTHCYIAICFMRIARCFELAAHVKNCIRCTDLAQHIGGIPVRCTIFPYMAVANLCRNGSHAESGPLTDLKYSMMEPN
jgi:hypothetical protein